jgi:hypothetical protein
LVRYLKDRRGGLAREGLLLNGRGESVVAERIGFKGLGTLRLHVFKGAV